MDERDRQIFMRQRADRAFSQQTPTQVFERPRAIIGPRANQLGQDAENARIALNKGQLPTPSQQAALEQAIRFQRQSLLCTPDGPPPEIEATSPLAAEWMNFRDSVPSLQRSIARLERVDDANDEFGRGRTPVGTGFLVASDVLLTAAHVVDELSHMTGRLATGHAVADFGVYSGNSGTEMRSITAVIALDAKLDLALLRIEPFAGDQVSRPILLPSIKVVEAGTPISVIGYPLDGSHNRPVFTSIVFGNRLGVKRAAIGEVISVGELAFDHDASTLAGNSGSPVFDLATGAVCGVHVGGLAMIRNEAVPGFVAYDFVASSLSLGRLERPSRSWSPATKAVRRSFDNYFAELKDVDPAVFEEVESTASTRAVPESTSARERTIMLETIVLTQGRPVLDIKDSAVILEMAEVESQIWKSRLQNVSGLLAPNIPSVGRIEIANHPRGVPWIGTGWVVRDNIVVTNRHVAEMFASAGGDGFLFRPGFDGGSMSARIDFLEEFGSDAAIEFPVCRVVHIESGGGPDLAFLRIEPMDGQTLPRAVNLSSTSVSAGDQIAVIGYPARDPLFPNPEEMDRIFNHRYDKKRLAPGMIKGASSDRLFHDCSTLGGNSGAVVLSLTTGEAVALHFAGTLFEKNHAVPIDIVASRLDDVLAGRARPARNSTPIRPDSAPDRRNKLGATQSDRILEMTIPIHLRIEIGDPAANASPIVQRSIPVLLAADRHGLEEIDSAAETRPEDYSDRDGYDPGFLGSGIFVPLPVLTRNQQDTLTFALNGTTHQTLDYRHFTVLMSSSRRMCRYSACNIDGRQSTKRKRAGWRYDPRIPKSAQILDECYGNEPKFSRGHMTRREDPVWGNSDEASQGNVDSMHVTNSVPQLQPFNAGIWLDLEDYALDHTREDAMRVCVFTGPFLSPTDPIRFGVQIPVEFWKIIAFIHDKTGDLCATGYTMSQESFLGGEEFVFGEHKSDQRPIAEIERRAGISFGGLSVIDPMANQLESVSTQLTHHNQICFF